MAPARPDFPLQAAAVLGPGGTGAGAGRASARSGSGSGAGGISAGGAGGGMTGSLTGISSREGGPAIVGVSDRSSGGGSASIWPVQRAQLRETEPFFRKRFFGFGSHPRHAEICAA